MHGEEKIDVLSSFVKGFKQEDISAINNGLFLAKELFNLNLGYKFRDHGDLGVISYSLCENLMGIKEVSNHKKIYDLGKRLSKYDSQKLNYMSKHLHNKHSGLFPEERKIAVRTLKSDFKK